MGRAACWCAQGAPRVAVRCSDLYEEGRIKHLAEPVPFWVGILNPTLKFLLDRYRGGSNLAKVQLNINSKALVAHMDRVV